MIASDITIEGKIEGAGNVRLAGRFKGDVVIQGDLTIEAGAKLTGSVRANAVVIAGEVEGNIESAQRVELQETGVLNGDLKAGTLTVAAGSRMRGRSEFGWGDEVVSKPALSWGQARSSEHLSGAGRRDSPLPALPGSDSSEREQLPGVSEASQVRTRRGGNPRAELFRPQPRGRGPASERRSALGILRPRLDQERQGRRGRAPGRERRGVGAG